MLHLQEDAQHLVEAEAEFTRRFPEVFAEFNDLSPAGKAKFMVDVIWKKYSNCRNER